MREREKLILRRRHDIIKTEADTKVCKKKDRDKNKNKNKKN